VFKVLTSKLQDFNDTCDTSPLLVLHLDEVDLLGSGMQPARKRRLLHGFLRSAGVFLFHFHLPIFVCACTCSKCGDILEGKVSRWCPSVKYVLIVWSGNINKVSE
jgi:hypothetical protein